MVCCCLKHPSFYRFGKPFVTLFGDVRPAESHHQIPTQHIFSSLSSSECSHRLGGWMPQNNYPDPPRLSHPRWPAGCILSVSKLLCIHARGSDRDHRALGPSTNQRPGNRGGDQSEGERVSPICVWPIGDNCSLTN